LIERRDREPRAAGSGVLRIAFAGRLAPRKGIAELLDAIAMVRSRGIEVRLQIFGSAPPGQEWRKTQYRQQAATLDLDDVVRFEGFVADLPRQLESVDVLVVPSQRPEPFGLVVLEGMAAGCAVVACRNGGGSDEILEHGVTGLYCGRTPSSIAAAIERLAHEPELRERLGDSASRAVRENYAVNRYLDGILRVYRDMLE
jgi:glycosyltransferase involved in cell wall biosynthesis